MQRYRLSTRLLELESLLIPYRSGQPPLITPTHTYRRLQVFCACVCACTCACVYECVLHDPYTSSSYTGQSLTQSFLLSHCLNLHPRQECRKKHAQHRSRGNKSCLCYIGSLPPQSLIECILRMYSPSGWLCAFLWDIGLLPCIVLV